MMDGSDVAADAPSYRKAENPALSESRSSAFHQALSFPGTKKISIYAKGRAAALFWPREQSSADPAVDRDSVCFGMVSCFTPNANGRAVAQQK